MSGRAAILISYHSNRPLTGLFSLLKVKNNISPGQFHLKVSLTAIICFWPLTYEINPIQDKSRDFILLHLKLDNHPGSQIWKPVNYRAPGSRIAPLSGPKPFFGCKWLSTSISGCNGDQPSPSLSLLHHIFMATAARHNRLMPHRGLVCVIATNLWSSVITATHR